MATPVTLVDWSISGLKITYGGTEYDPEDMPDAVVDLLVTALERWELRNG